MANRESCKWLLLPLCPKILEGSEGSTNDILSVSSVRVVSTLISGGGHLNCYNQICYRPQTKFAKVMFLHVSVILSTGGLPTPGGGLVLGDAFSRWGACSGGGSGPGGCLVETPPRRLLLRAVCILLECILV